MTTGYQSRDIAFVDRSADCLSQRSYSGVEIGAALVGAHHRPHSVADLLRAEIRDIAGKGRGFRKLPPHRAPPDKQEWPDDLP
ncbi:hypothetical protein [Nocardia gipuzkoensis]|uniref:hypothetical protein n=1 Tax=Nocardia gipuzkoensis TaxID=2749991 RepID=UPI0015EE722F|nr:hypothetical protein [Nocardia gipuzkoensis]